MIYSNALIDFLSRQYEENGSISKYEVDGELHFFINSPELIQQVLQKKHKVYHKSDFYKELRHVIGNGLLTVTGGDDWLWQRRMTQPSFNRHKINDFAQDIEGLSLELVENWKRSLKTSDTIQVHNEFVKITLAVICRTLLGIKATDEAKIIIDNFPFILKFISVRVFHPNPLDLSQDTPGNKKFKSSMAALEEIVVRYIDEKLAQKKIGFVEGDDLLASLIQEVDEETGKPLEYKEIRDHVMTQFLAGHETTVTSLAYIVYHLAKYPDWQNKLWEECKEEKDWWEYEGVLHFIYESLRLYPPIPLIGKVATRDDSLGGYHIPKGAYVTLSPLILHRTPKYWENSEEFDPARFEHFDLRSNKFLYIPFSTGPRVCIGMQLALMEMVIIIKNILRSFKLTINDKTDPTYLIALSLRARGGMSLNLELRDA